MRKLAPFVILGEYVLERILRTYFLPSRSRGVAQPGRAPGSGPGGRRFKSSLPDHFFVLLARLKSSAPDMLADSDFAGATNGEHHGLWCSMSNPVVCMWHRASLPKPSQRFL
jgi:hypothetical protein